MDDHAAILTIDLAALASNWRLLQARVGAGECGAVVKGDAYGLGIEAAVPALAKAGCHTFFVAHLSEGIRVRAAAPEAAIYVLNGYADARTPDYLAHRLRPVLGTIDDIRLWAGVSGGEPAALHVDTAMNRLGIRPEIAREVIGSANLREIGIGLLMTHFAASEMPADPVNAAQIAAFGNLVVAMRGSPANRNVSASLCNSSGLFLPGIEPHQLARPGYALYGGNPTPGRPNPMRAVLRLDAPVIAVSRVRRGERVGYNGNWTAPRDSRIATISCGYADGYPRNAGNSAAHPGGAAVVAGRECPFAGNVSMDLITIDVTALPENAVKPGDFATLLGAGLDVDRVGASARTSGYEILTSLGRRYRRRLAGG